MNDFLLAILLTILVSAIIIFVDFIFGTYIIYSNTIKLIMKRKKNSGDNLRGKLKYQLFEDLDKIYKEISLVETHSASLRTWGTDLSSLSLTLNIAAFGMWMSHPEFFPFFKHWNTIATSWDLGIWIIVLFITILFLLLSICLKHFHSVKCYHCTKVVSFDDSKGEWISQNNFMIFGFIVGGLALFISFIVLMNCVPFVN